MKHNTRAESAYKTSPGVPRQRGMGGAPTADPNVISESGLKGGDAPLPGPTAGSVDQVNSNAEGAKHPNPTRTVLKEY